MINTRSKALDKSNPYGEESSHGGKEQLAALGKNSDLATQVVLLQQKVAILTGMFSNNFPSRKEETTIENNPLRAKTTPFRRQDTGLADRMKQEEDNKDDVLSIVPSLEGNNPRPSKVEAKVEIPIFDGSVDAEKNDA